jgi:hypothetical protein
MPDGPWAPEVEQLSGRSRHKNPSCTTYGRWGLYDGRPGPRRACPKTIGRRPEKTQANTSGPPVAHERLCPFARQGGGTETAEGWPSRSLLRPGEAHRSGTGICCTGEGGAGNGMRGRAATPLYCHHRLCKHTPATAILGRQPVRSWCARANSRRPWLTWPNIPARGSRPGGRVSCGAVRRGFG